MIEKHLEVWESHRKSIDMLSKMSNSYILVAELCTRYWYLSDNFSFWGYNPDIINRSDIPAEYFESRIHPDDLIVLRATQNRLIELINALPIEERKDYKHILECRLKGNDENYVRVIIQQQILELDRTGNPWLMLGIIDISPDMSGKQVKIRIINYKTGEIVPFRIFEQNEGIKLSEKEKEILEMARKGMLSKEISDSLKLSIHTVNKHRQNIMHKMNSNNILEAIDYAKRLGIFD